MIKVAFCTEDGIGINSHFARSPLAAIYEFNKAEYCQKEDLYFDDAEFEFEDRVDAKIKQLTDCAIVYCTSIGGPAAARLIQSGIHPVKAKEDTLIEDEVKRLNVLFSKNPPRWLEKKLDREQEGMK